MLVNTSTRHKQHWDNIVPSVKNPRLKKNRRNLSIHKGMLTCTWWSDGVSTDTGRCRSFIWVGGCRPTLRWCGPILGTQWHIFWILTKQWISSHQHLFIVTRRSLSLLWRLELAHMRLGTCYKILLNIQYLQFQHTAHETFYISFPFVHHLWNEHS